MMSEEITIKIKKRPWYEWLLWAIWLYLDIFIAKNASASSQELEPRAAAIFWVVFALFTLAGLVVWFVRRAKE